ncbi:MAG: dihydroneopterin aldolase [Gammaproteobacteria bacterium]|nr:dihydroneopterin aldolase [Gammaproteobacteria bacterium]
MDIIQIRGLKLEAVIGVHAWEQRLPRPLLLDLELATDARRAATRDELADAVDYAAVVAAVCKLATESRYKLLETLAEAVARLLVTQFGVARVKVTVHKPGAVAAAQDVAVTIERARADYPA